MTIVVVGAQPTFFSNDLDLNTSFHQNCDQLDLVDFEFTGLVVIVQGRSTIEVDLDTEGNTAVTIRKAGGHQVYCNEVLPPIILTIDIANWSAGEYIIDITAPNYTSTHVIVI